MLPPVLQYHQSLLSLRTSVADILTQVQYRKGAVGVPLHLGQDTAILQGLMLSAPPLLGL